MSGEAQTDVDAPIIGAKQSSVLSTSFSSVDIGYTLGGFAGSWAGGAAIGYMVQRKSAAAITGGLAASGFWSVAESIRTARASNWLLAAFLAASGGASLYMAYRRSKR